MNSLRIIDPIFGNKLDEDSLLYKVLSEDYFNTKLASKLKLYYLLRPYIPLRIRKFLQQISAPAMNRREWFISKKLLSAYYEILKNEKEVLTTNFWPNRKKWCFILTHDVESEEGVKNIERIAELESKYGFKSSWNFVPYKYHLDKGLLTSLVEKGFEIGIHGYNHDGRLFFSKKLFQQRAKYINKALLKFKAVGFRAPAVHRNLVWMQALNILYDSSCFDIDPFQPIPGGTGSVWPYIVGKFVEIPYTLPQDHVLFYILRDFTNTVWKEKAKWLMRKHGIVCMLTHPDYLKEKHLLYLYEDFLNFIAENNSDFCHMLPKELANWWIERLELLKNKKARVLKVIAKNEELEFEIV